MELALNVILTLEHRHDFVDNVAGHREATSAAIDETCRNRHQLPVDLNALETDRVCVRLGKVGVDELR
jgi:hypothetical protein